MTTKTATLLKDSLTGFNGHASLYKLDPPMGDHDWGNDAHEYDNCDGSGDCIPVEYVIVSAVTLPKIATLPDMPTSETYIFPGTPDGEIASWGELDGSTKNTLDHAEALRNAGYEVTVMTYASRAAVIDRLIAEHGLTGKDVLRFSFLDSGDVELHMYGPLPDVDYERKTIEPYVHHTARITREELEIRLTYLTMSEVPA